MNINDDDDQQCSLLGRELPLCLRLHKIYRFSNIIGSSSSPSSSQPSPWSPSSSWLSMSSSSSPSSSLASISLCASGAQLGSDGSSLQTSNNQEVPPQHGHHHLHIFIIKVIKVKWGRHCFHSHWKELKLVTVLYHEHFVFLYGLLGQANWWALYGSLGSGQLIRKKLTYLQRVPTDVGVHFFLQRIEAMIHWISKTWCSTPDYWICIGERRVGRRLGSIFWCGHLDQEGRGGLSWTKRGCQQDIHTAPVHSRRKKSSRVHITFCLFVRLPESNVLGRYLNIGNATPVGNNFATSMARTIS